MRVIIEVPAGENYQLSVGHLVSIYTRMNVRYIKPGERVELSIENGAHLTLTKEKLPILERTFIDSEGKEHSLSAIDDAKVSKCP